MENSSAAGTSAASGPAPEAVPPCVGIRAQELLDLAVLRFLALCLGVSGGLQGAALWIALLSPPHLYYLPEIG